jgi:hypothetical protein
MAESNTLRTVSGRPPKKSTAAFDLLNYKQMVTDKAVDVEANLEVNPEEDNFEEMMNCQR